MQKRGSYSTASLLTLVAWHMNGKVIWVNAGVAETMTIWLGLIVYFLGWDNFSILATFI